MIAVSDSSPLISLARIGKLDLLRTLFGRIHICPEVWTEVVDTGHGRPAAEQVRVADWIEVHAASAQAQTTLREACAGLGTGERGTILLTEELKADVVLLDERRARRVALHAGLNVTGCMGLLEAGAAHGYVTDLRSAYLDLLRQGIRYDIRLLQGSLARLGLPQL